MVELRRADVDADRGIGGAADTHLAHALNLRKLLLHDGRRRIVHRFFVVLVRGEAENHDGRIGGVDFAVAGVGGQVGGQVGTGGVDAGLDVAGRGIDVAAEVELQCHIGAAERAGRGHLGDAGNVAKLALEGRRHRRRHDLRAGTGEPRLYVDGGEIHLGQRRDGQDVEGDAAGDGDSHGEQGGGDRAADKR